jgi:hypothetical protein
MTTLDDFFRAPPDALLHPRLREWKQRFAKPGVKPELKLYTPATLLGISQTELTLQLTGNGEPHLVETVAWDDDLNAGLIDLGVRCACREDEVERFALGLRAAMRKALREFGDGYFNSVLVEFLAESDLKDHPEIADVLKDVSVNPPDRETSQGAAGNKLCREMIADAITGRAYELKQKLSYSEEDAKKILVGALAKYVDERFAVSRRRRLGVL